MMTPENTTPTRQIPLSTALGRRLALLIVGFSTLVSAFTTGFELYYDYRQDRSRLDQMLEQPPLSYESIGKSLWDFDEAQIMLSIEALARLPNVSSITVVADGPNGKVWETKNAPAKHYVERHFPLRYTSRSGDETKTNTIGTLTIVASLDQIDDRILSRAGIVLAGNFLKTLLVASFMLLLFRRLITARIHALSAHVQDKARLLLSNEAAQLEPVNVSLSSTSSGNGSDEIDTLHTTFDQLCRRIADHNTLLSSEVARQTAELSRRERDFRTLVEHLPLGIALVNADGNVARFNPAFTRLLGYSFENTPDPDTWWNNAFPDLEQRMDAQRTWHELVTLPPDLAEPALRTRTLWVTRADGQSRLIDFTVQPFPDQRIVVTLVDITDRRKAEEALQASEQRFRSFVENINDELFVLNDSGNFTYISPQWETTSGYSIEETVGHSFAPFLHPDDVPLCADILQRVMSTGEKLSGIEYRVRLKNGTYSWYRANVSRTTDPQTGAPLLVGIGRDITQIKIAQEALAHAKQGAERANLAKTRFLAAASHDLRQPVTAINLFCDSLRNTSLTDEQRQITHYLAQTSANMSNLLESLLDVSMLDTGRLNPRIHILPALDVMSNIEVGYAPVAQAKSLRFKIFFPQRDTLLYSDGQLLNRLLGNLVANAIKYTEHGGVLVSLRRRRDHAVFQVWDTGRGIALEHIGDIFEEYFQVGNPERDASKGLGLGLAIAIRLARLLGTEIKCRSRPGRGSVFEFKMPLITAQKIPPELLAESVSATA